MKSETLLWADDEVDLLKPHILFLRQKGYEVVTVNNGLDALDRVKKEHFDLIILDENMPGLSGLETLTRMKEVAPHVPVIMITKSEEEDIMNQAIGNKIADYLIKPVNPNQIWLSIKKNLYGREIISEETSSGYQQEFSRISMQINGSLSWNDWYDVYRKLVFWELELEQTGGHLKEMLLMQKNDANSAGWAEFSIGAAKGCRNAVILTLGTGVGAGIIVDGHLLKGKSGAAGEMHFPVDSGHKRVCSGCGMFDCFESFASGTGLNANAREYMGAEATSYDVIRGLKEGDHQARAAFDKWQDYLIKGLIMVANVFDPEVIVLSGSMAKFVEYDKVSREVNGRILTQPFELKEAAVENNAGMIGAALLLIARIK